MLLGDRSGTAAGVVHRHESGAGSVLQRGAPGVEVLGTPGALRTWMVATAVRHVADAVPHERRHGVLAVLDDVLGLLEVDTKPARQTADLLLRGLRLVAGREHTKLLVDVSNACLLPASAGGSSFVALARRLVAEQRDVRAEVVLVAQLGVGAGTPERIGEMLEACAAITAS